MPWPQTYDPLGSRVLSTLVAALPVVVLLGALASGRVKAHWAALLGLASALAVATAVFGMPAGAALASAAFGAAYGLFPIGWIVVNVIFLYQITSERGLFAVLQRSIASITADRRLQLLLIAFSFGSFFEGAAGFGTPVAITSALLIGVGFSPLQASGLSLIANTAPVAFGAMGTPIVALQGVTGLDLHALSATVGRQLPVFSLIVPVWLVCAYAGARRALEVWPALLVAGVSFALPQFLVSNYHGPWLVDVAAGSVSIAALALFLRVWRPRGAAEPAPPAVPSDAPAEDRRAVRRAWLPWAVLTAFVFVWGLPPVKAALNAISLPTFEVPGLHRQVLRVPPAVSAAQPEAAVFALNWLSATGTSILLAAVVAGLLVGCTPRELAATYGRTLRLVRHSLLTIAAMLALGYTSRYAGLDAVLGLAFAGTGVLYPFFGTLLGWLGVALTGSDTSSNVLFGSLQRITAEQLGLSPTLMAAANSSGGVMGKMVDAQSIVVASTATRWYGHEGAILRYVFLHSIALATLVGVLVMLQAYVAPFTRMVK
ncbi:MAG TPA: L-lactate permease [Gemmatimonadaceae bacterium]|nr:L-lactate permease [Gemmatimonadaceae bacterium]